MRERISKIVNIYVVLLIAVFPLFMTDAYYDIQDAKINCVLVLTYGVVILSGLSLIASLIITPSKERGTALRGLFRELKEVCGIPAAFMLLFYIAIIISTVLSEWHYEAFWGNMGRYQGLYLWTVYIVGFYMTALFYEPKRWHMELLILIGAVISIWGILDYLYLSPIGWQDTVEEFSKLDFSSGIGNINHLTCVEGMYLLVTAAMWIKERDRVRSILYLVVTAIHIAALIVAYSDNALMSVAASLCFLPFYAFSEAEGVRRYFLLYPAYALGMLFVSIIAVPPGTRGDMRNLRDGVLYDFCRYHGSYVLIIVIVSLVLAAAVWLITRRLPGGEGDRPGEKLSPVSGRGQSIYTKLRIAWAGVLVLMALIGIIILIDANIMGHAGRYGALSNILIFDDDWGTHRGFNWKLAASYIVNLFSPREMLFGSGLETYSLYTLTHDYYNMVNNYNVIFDSPHNEWLQMFFTTGIIGFVTYYGTYISTMVCGFRSADEAKRQLSAAYSFGLLAYLLVSFVNVGGVNSTAIAVLLLGMISALAGRGTRAVPWIKKERGAGP